MQGEVIPQLGVDAVAGKASAQTVGTVVHGLHALDDGLTVHPLAFPGDHGGDGAAGGNPDLSFQLFHVRSAFRGMKKDAQPQKDRLLPRLNIFVLGN